MGRPFKEELHAIGTTLRWAQTVDIFRLNNFLVQCSDDPLYTVGVGGSFTAATLAADLHRARGVPAIPRTTLEFCSTPAPLRNANIILFTAAGRNRDVLRAFDYAVAAEPRSLLVLCASKGSPIKRRAEKFWDVVVFDFALPTGHDGFLASKKFLSHLYFFFCGLGVLSGSPC